MGVYIADAQGAIDKDVPCLMVADTQGAIDKDIQKGYVSPDVGAMDKLFYANWQYTTGEILANSVGIRLVDDSDVVVNTAPLGSSIKPVTIKMTSMASCYNPGDVATARLKAEYYTGSSWVSLGTYSYSVPDYSVTITRTFTMSGEIETTQLRYTIDRVSGPWFESQILSGKCTVWYEKG